MHRGYIKSWRRKIDSLIWKMPPVYMRVFDWIIHSVNHELVKLPTPTGIVTVSPGQRLTSLRQIAEGVAHYEYGIARVPNVKTISAVLSWLEGNGKITLESNGKGTVITVNNWDTYNHKDDEEVTAKEQLKVTAREQTLDTNKNEKNEKKESLNPLCENQESILEAEKLDDIHRFQKDQLEKAYQTKRSILLADFEIFWNAFGYKKGRHEAEQSWLKIKDYSPQLLEIIISAAQHEAQNRPALTARGTTPKMAQGWLTGRRWEDDRTLVQGIQTFAEIKITNTKKVMQNFMQQGDANDGQGQEEIHFDHGNALRSIPNRSD